MKHFKQAATISAVCSQHQPVMGKYHGNICPYCGRVMDKNSRSLKPTRDHIRAQQRFKSEGDKRVIVVCMDCNSLKGDKTLEEFLAALYLELTHARLLEERIAHLDYLLRVGLR